MQNTKTTLVFLQENVSDKQLIRQALDQFDEHADLHQAVDDWKNKPAADKTWNKFKIHFSKEITKTQK